MKAKSIFLSPDFVISGFFWVAIVNITPIGIDLQTICDLTLMKIQVSSIVFSFFFAALALFTAAGSDSFIRFLENECESAYCEILKSYKFTLGLLGTSLVIETALYTVYKIIGPSLSPISTWSLICATTGFFTWAILAAIMSAFDSIRLHQFRVMHSTSSS